MFVLYFLKSGEDIVVAIATVRSIGACKEQPAGRAGPTLMTELSRCARIERRSAEKAGFWKGGREARVSICCRSPHLDVAGTWGGARMLRPDDKLAHGGYRVKCRSVTFLWRNPVRVSSILRDTMHH
jgi:hypothetical protein